MRNLLLLLAALLLFSRVSAQLADSSIHMYLYSPIYSGLMPGRDLANRFGFVSTVGAHATWKPKGNWFYTTGITMLFSEQVKETTMLDAFKIGTGDDYYVITDEGQPTQFRYQCRGLVVPLTVGRLFPFGPNPNSGFYLELGGQYIQHRIHLRTTDGDYAPIMKGRQKGYDRFTTGLGAREVIGYRFLDNDGFVNFSLGLEFSQNFTRNRRSINVDTGLTDNTLRQDLLSGFFITWHFPRYNRVGTRYYY